MSAMPRDMTDLYLAPVVLAVNTRLEEYAALSPTELAKAVALASDLPDDTEQFRAAALLKALAHFNDLHDWTLTLDPRGVRVTHGDHSLVLGMPTNVASYLAGG